MASYATLERSLLDTMASNLESATQKADPVTLGDLMVQDRQTGALVPLHLNVPQQMLMAWLGLDPDDPFPVIAHQTWRKRILKARREGITTLLMALFFLDTYNNAERFSVIVAHDEESSAAIFEIVRRFYRHLPPEKKRPATRQSGTELLWPGTNSRFIAATAGSENLLSGATIHNLHKSERAKWRGDAEAIANLDASLNIAARWGNIVEETTAKGLNHFRTDWMDSQFGRSIYEPYFLPWFADPGNRLPVPPGFERTEEEEERVSLYGLDDEQLVFYRQAKMEHKKLVGQEYPHTSAEAFLTSADNAVYDTAYLHKLLAWLELPDQQSLKIVEMDDVFAGYRGTLEIYEYAESGVDYVIGADCAEGMRPDKGHDDSTCEVYRCDTWEQVACYWGQPRTEQFGDILDYLGHEYNEAEITVEDDPRGYGRQCLSRLSELSYPNIYRTTVKMLDTGETERDGYQVSVKSKTKRDETLKELIADAAEGLDSLLIRSRRAVGQLLTYVDKGNGVREGDGSAHDDHNTSTGLCAVRLKARGFGGGDGREYDAGEPVTLYGEGAF